MSKIDRRADQRGTSSALRGAVIALIVLCTAALAACGGQSTVDPGSVTQTAPTITVQPENLSVTVGATATFSVVASGTAPLSYQWSMNGTVIAGATSASYTTAATVSGDNGETFGVQVSNAAGNVMSTAATLTVTADPVAPTITTEPASQSVTVGATATFTVLASGTAPLTYQWLMNGSAIAGANSASYTTEATVTGDNGSTFSVQVSNAVGSMTSSTATLTVTSSAVAPTITTQPQSQTVTVGAKATFTVVASGTAPLTYQWSKNGTAISGASSASYTTPATASGDSGSTFSVKVSNNAGSMSSSAATLTVNAASVAPTITTQPQSQSVTVGATAIFTVVATGTAPLSYQWSKNGTAISGATNASYTTPATVSGDNGSTFSVLVSNNAGSKTSNAATLTVNTASVAPTVTTQPQNANVLVGGTATFTVAASGTAPLSYQWLLAGVAIPGATTASYTTPAEIIGNSGSLFSVQVSNAAGTATSNTATLTVMASGGAGAPIMFQHITSSTNPIGNGISGHAFVFHTESLPPNTVAVMGVTAPTANSVTISDTLVGSWSSAVCSANGGSGNYKAWVFAQNLGSSAGPDTITINVGSSDIQPVQFDITLWQNISTASPADGSLCTGNVMPSSGGLVSPGSFTPSTNNDVNGGHVIWNYTALCSAQGSANPTSWAPAAGFNLLNGEIIWVSNQGFPQGSEYYLQTTNGSVTPTITATGDTANCYNSASVALKVANDGANPISGIHVAAIGHESFASFSSPGTMKIQVPWSGNLRVLAFTWLGDSPGGNVGYISAITSSDSCNFTEASGMHGAGGGSIWYAQNCAPCPTCTVSLKWTGSFAEPQGSFRYFDVANAQASSYQNNVSDGIVSCPTTVNGAPSFTPTGASSGLTIQVMGDGTGPVEGLASGAPAGATFDLWTFAGQTDSDLADNADATSHYYYQTTATQNWNFNIASAEECTPAAAAFN